MDSKGTALTSPFSVGNSPFCVKGVAYSGVRSQYDAIVPGGFEAVVAALTTGTLRGFAEQHFFSSVWYDIFPMVVMDTTGAKITGLPLQDFVRRCVEHQALLDMRGVYKVVLRFLSPWNAVQKLSIFSSTYFNFAVAKASRAGENEVRVTTTGVPLSIATWFDAATAYYVGYCLRFTNVRDVHHAFYAPEQCGVAHGVPVATSAWSISWKTPNSTSHKKPPPGERPK